MTGTILLLLFYLLTPVLIILLCNRYPWLNKIGAIVIAYVLGLLVGNAGILGKEASGLQEILTTVTIPLALPLLLFSLSVNRWWKLAGRTMLSMVLALVALTIVVTIGHALWHDQIRESWKVAGMLIGVYSGGTPNLASIKTALNVDETTYILTHTYDIVLCAVYLLFLLTIGKVLFRWFLPRFRFGTDLNPETSGVHTTDDYNGFFKKGIIVPLAGAMGVAVLIFGIGGGLSMVVPESVSMVTAILSITTLGIIASFIPAINRIKRTFELGMYFILVFSLVVASMANIRQFDLSSLYLFYYVGLAVFGSLLLHVLFSKIFRIDADTTMITSIAMIFSPPFVPVLAGALKNRQVILSGLAAGILGYAAGNYLGVLVAYMLK